MALSSLDGRFIEVNPAALRLFGMPRDEVIGRTSTEVGLLPVQSRAAEDLAARVLRHGLVRNEPRTIRSRSGQLYDLLLLADLAKIGGELCYVSTFIDVTEHQRSIDDLASSESHYRRIVESAREGICISDAEGRFTFVNSRMAEVLGYRAEEMLGMSVFSIIDAKDRDKLEKLIERRKGGIAEGGEFKVIHRDGRELWVLFESSPIFEAGGRYAGVLTGLLDITERVLAEERLKKSEALLEEAQALAHVGSWEWNLVTDVVTRSNELCRIFGMSPENFGTSPSSSYERVHPDDRERLRSEIERARREHRPWEIEYRIVRPDGVRVLLARGQVICDEAGTPVRMVGTAQDVTERREIEARVVLADRMASVGTLAAGVAHEINNPLAYVIADLDLIAESMEKVRCLQFDGVADLAALVLEARQGAERVRKIVRDLKTFSRAEEDRRVSLDPRHALDLAIDIAAPRLRYRARLAKDYGSVPAVEADESRLIQVFVNLLINAADAMPEGRADLNEVRVATRTDANGRAVVEISDTGNGIAPEVLGHIFDPFFTTKRLGAGTGLGLSVCHGIISALGGEITAQSEMGKGSVFRVVVPPGRQQVMGKANAREVAPVDIERSRRILVVDDEPLIGAVIRRTLSEHDVTVARHGKEALALLASCEPFDLIFCDLMMPEMTGMDFHAELSRSFPELVDRVIFMTGGAFSPTAKSLLERASNEWLEKPFDGVRLKALARRALP